MQDVELVQLHLPPDLPAHVGRLAHSKEAATVRAVGPVAHDYGVVEILVGIGADLRQVDQRVDVWELGKFA